ncbi:MAG: hypothetical protein KIT36_09465 [Alphaproteobacteria bacterium]|nr:hypothetical protein [Alphaproteobacteria bacterium]
MDHEARLILAIATGALGRKDVDAYMAGIAAEGAAGFRVLFDALAADFDFQPSDLAAIGQVVKDRKRETVSDGRIALVVGSDAEQDIAAYLVDRVNHQRPCRVFRSISDAKAWLDLT